jgi:DNA replication protein DnaC
VLAPAQDETGESLLPPLPEDACPVCKGSGWLRMDTQPGDPNFGRLVPCRCTTEKQNQLAMDKLKRQSNLDAFRDKTFDTFNSRVKGAREAYDAAYNFARDPDGWLLLFGNYGTGKTHLAAAIANQVMRQLNMRVYFAVVPDLLDFLRATFDPSNNASYDDRFDEIKNVPLLVLDDLGTENASPWAREKLYQIINHRYNLKLPTVFTTNVDMDMLDGRIRSRLSDSALCRLLLLADAEDYRQLTPERRERLRNSPPSDYNRNAPGQNNPPRNNYRKDYR